MSAQVPLARPWFGPEETEALSQVLGSGWVSQGPRVEKFETQLAELLECDSVVAVNSGTSALMLTLRALDIGPGDSVIVPAFGCPATALPVLETGAKLVFADIDSVSFNLTWDTISAALTKDTRAVILVHMFGQVADVETIAAECKRRQLILVEDAALAFGARRAGRLCGTFGAAGCFSFHPRKILTTGEGGAVCTKDPRLAARLRESRNYGAARTAWARYQSSDGHVRGFDRLGFNCKLTDLQAAIGLVQLTRLAEFLERRRQIAFRYDKELGGCRCLTLPPCLANPFEHVFQAYVCTWTPEPLDHFVANPARLEAAQNSLNLLKENLSQAGVAVSEAAQFLPELPVFGSFTSSHPFPNALVASRLAFAIPLYPGMTDAQIDLVIEALRGAIE